MPKKVKIIADSPSDLSPELYRKYDVSVLPLTVSVEEKDYLDGVDIFPDDLYASYKRCGKLPKTAAPSLSAYSQEYKKWTDLGYAVINFHISSEFSGAYNNASIAAKEFEDVYPIDSKNLSTGIGLLVLEAAELAQQGMEAGQIVERILALREKVRASFIIDTLQYLWKGGRCSGVAALGANVLRLKPCIEVTDGKMVVGKKYRGSLSSALHNYVADKLTGKTDLQLKRIFVTHSGMSDPAMIDEVVAQVKSLQPFSEVLITRAGCTVSSHCGPNTLGILYLVK